LDALLGVGEHVRIVDEATVVADFTGFVRDFERPLRHGLIAACGGELGREAASEALAYGWENWERVRALENPVGYLYKVGRNWARRSQHSKPLVLRLVGDEGVRNVEPGLAAAVAGLTERQRTVVVLVHCFAWSLAEVADVLGLAKTTVQNHLERGMSTLRRELGESR
jgi:RNA polymerase sigma-70 factor (ECF subfamily)